MNWRSLFRITGSTVLASIAILGGFRWALPHIAIPNLWPVALALPAILAMVVINFAVLTLIPPRVTIRRDKIVVSHGDSCVLIDPANVTVTHLTVHGENRIRLRICYTRKTKRKARTIGIPPTMDFHALAKLLPIPPVVRDARSRAPRTRKPTEPIG